MPTHRKRKPLKRARSVPDASPLAHWSNPATLTWAHAEWFLPYVDEAFFTPSEFQKVITADMGLTALVETPTTRAEWSRVRAAMCNSFPGGFAKPRRLSAAFLDAELSELETYRTDARAIMREAPLQPACDSSTGVPLPDHWWGRYRCPQPFAPARGSAIIVRVVSNDPLQRFRLRPAVFLALTGPAANRVRFSDDDIEAIVSDLDVMLASPHTVSQQETAGLLPSPAQYSPLSFSPSLALDPIFEMTHVSDVPPPLVNLSASPQPALVFVSPKNNAAAKLPIEDSMECEVDLRRVAESMRLLERKTDLVQTLSRLNDTTAAAGVNARQQLDEKLVTSYEGVMRELHAVDTDLTMLLHPRQEPLDRLRTPDQFRTPDRTPLMRPGLISPRTRPARIAPARLRPEHQAKNVDFRNANGAALLAKTLTRAALADLGPESTLKSIPTNVRADVMECVSACVAVLVRARVTRDFKSIQEVVNDIRVRFPDNEDALDAIHTAARTFDDSDSDNR